MSREYGTPINFMCIVWSLKEKKKRKKKNALVIIIIQYTCIQNIFIVK